MNETHIKHGYSSMVCDARGAILNPEAKFRQPGGAILKSGEQHCPPPPRAGFLTSYVSSGERICKVMHSGADKQGFGILMWKDVGTKKNLTQSSKLGVSCRSFYASPEDRDA